MFSCLEKFQITFIFFLGLSLQSNNATWSKKDGASRNSGIQITTNFDVSKYPVCHSGSKSKECNIFYECQNVCNTVNRPSCVTRPKLDCTIHKRKECKSVQDVVCNNRVPRSSEDFNANRENEVNYQRSSNGFPVKSFHMKTSSKVKVKHKEKVGLNLKPNYLSQSSVNDQIVDKNCNKVLKTVCNWIPYKKKCINRPVTECSGSFTTQQCNKKCENVYYCTNCPSVPPTTTTTTTVTTTTTSTVPPAPIPPPYPDFTTPQPPILTTTPFPDPLPPSPPLETFPPSPQPGVELPSPPESALVPLPPSPPGEIGPPSIPVGPPATPIGFLPSGEEVLPPSPPVGPIVSPPAPPPQITTKRPTRPSTIRPTSRPTTKRPTKPTTLKPTGTTTQESISTTSSLNTSVAPETTTTSARPTVSTSRPSRPTRPTRPSRPTTSKRPSSTTSTTRLPSTTKTTTRRTTSTRRPSTTRTTTRRTSTMRTTRRPTTTRRTTTTRSTTVITTPVPPPTTLQTTYAPTELPGPPAPPPDFEIVSAPAPPTTEIFQEDFVVVESARDFKPKDALLPQQRKHFGNKLHEYMPDHSDLPK